MERILYVVSHEQPLLSGYLRTTVGDRSDGHPVEIKVDERRAERRLSPDSRHPERRRGERRLQPSLDGELRSRGFATVVRSAASASRTVEPAPARRPRSTWGPPASRAWKRSRIWWGVAVILLAALGVGILMALRPPGLPSPSALQVAPPIEKAPPLPPTAKAETVVPAVPAPPPSRPASARIVRTRSTGVVLSVDPRTRMLVLEDRGVAGDAGRLRIEVAPDVRVVLSERDDQAEDPSRPFKDTAIDLSDVRRGDYVVVQTRGPEGKELAWSVMVTFRPMK